MMTPFTRVPFLASLVTAIMVVAVGPTWADPEAGGAGSRSRDTGAKPVSTSQTAMPDTKGTSTATSGRTNRMTGAPPPASPAPQATEGPGYDISISGYGGLAVPFKTDMEVKNDPDFGNFTIKGLTLRNAPTFGARITGWTPWIRQATGLDLGAELDYTRFSPSIKSGGSAVVDGTELEAARSSIANQLIAVNLLVRRPFGVTPEFPHGQWYPYAGVGGGVSIARAKIIDPEIVNFLGSQPQETDTAGMWQVLVGAKVFIARHVAIFGEYKNTYARHTFNFGTPNTITIHANHFIVGVALHY